MSRGVIMIAGTDEAGRGPLAGPVVAAAAVLTQEQRKLLVSAGLRDSKKLTPRKREMLFEKICSNGVVWEVQLASAQQIDKVNILQASLWCMRCAVERLSVQPSLVLVDGNRLIPGLNVPQKAIVKGDDLVPAIAAASVIAKVLRDRIMTIMDSIYPQYAFAKHKGYPSALHKKLLAEYGPSPIHRLSFKGVLARNEQTYL